MSFLFLCLFTALLIATTDAQQLDFIRTGACDPLVPDQCSFPYPNNFYLRNDASTETGKRVYYDLDTLPKDRKGQGIDPYEYNSFDGHSPYPMIMTFFPELVDDQRDTIPHHWDLSMFSNTNISTILLETNTNTRVAHWCEIDMWTPIATRRAFMMHPAHRLNDDTNYIVAMRNLYSPTGALVQPSAAFLALRDDLPSSDPDVEGRRELYNNVIFPALAAQGFDRHSLQIAWDFSTASKKSMIERLQPMRDDALTNHMPINGPHFTIKQVLDEYNTGVFRKIVADIEYPLYMDFDGPGSHLVLDSNGIPVYQQQAQYEVTILIPRTFVSNPRKGRIVQYGHGLFGGQGEVEASYLADIANLYGYIMVAGDWLGMSYLDVEAVLQMMMTDLSEFAMVSDRIQQGIICKIFTVRALLTTLGQNELFTFGGVNIIEGTTGYFGNSQGGILGVPLIAAHIDITRAVFGVGGGPYALLLPRSADFPQYAQPIQLRYEDPMDQMTLFNFFGPVFDRGEPGGYVTYLSENLLPNTPKHNVLWHYANHDSEVTWLGAYGCARSSKSYMFEGNVNEHNETIWGFEYVQGSITGENVIQGYDYNKPPVPKENIPPTSEHNTHTLPSKEATAWAQMDQFFKTGEIIDFCNGEGCWRDQ